MSDSRNAAPSTDARPVDGEGSLFARNIHTRRIKVDILLLSQFDLGDLSGLADVFQLANASTGRPLFEVRCVGLDGGPVESSSGLTVAVEADIYALLQPENLVVLGGAALAGAELTIICGLLRRLFKSGCRLGAIGVAARLLMETGLMRNRSVATSLGVAHAWRELFPEVALTERIYQVDQGIFTCRGGSATIDLALQGVCDHLGDVLTAQIAGRFNLCRVRSAADTQLAAPLMRARRRTAKLQQAIELFRRHEDVNRTSREIAGKLNLSQRQVQRLFNRHLNARPHEYAVRCRLEKARQLVAHSPLSITEIAMAAGFVSPSHFSRRYRMHYGVSPTADRKLMVTPSVRHNHFPKV